MMRRHRLDDASATFLRLAVDVRLHHRRLDGHVVAEVGDVSFGLQHGADLHVILEYAHPVVGTVRQVRVAQQSWLRHTKRHHTLRHNSLFRQRLI